MSTVEVVFLVVGILILLISFSHDLSQVLIRQSTSHAFGLILDVLGIMGVFALILAG
jgi:hypothetical protein